MKCVVAVFGVLGAVASPALGFVHSGAAIASSQTRHVFLLVLTECTDCQTSG